MRAYVSDKRSILSAFPGTYAAATSSTIVAGIDPESTKLMTVDMRNGEITERIDEVAYKIRDSHLRLANVDNVTIQLAC